jgi:hypothetical protein
MGMTFFETKLFADVFSRKRGKSIPGGLRIESLRLHFFHKIVLAGALLTG